ncbi:MAG: hypothetical protein SGJ20_06400 [Planctomycetota bacterium]|nr:hypothetical protein [Planctomycetota bacterium]
MFGMFSAKCPVDQITKDWIEDRLHWLGKQFGYDVFLRRAVILPLAEFFPDRFDKSVESVQAMYERICRYMDIPEPLPELNFFQGTTPFLVNGQGHAVAAMAGLYDNDGERVIIHLKLSEIEDPLPLVGILAHELAHHRLLGEDRLYGDEFDHELLTDLTVVFHGLGVFLANAPRSWLSDFSQWPDGTPGKPEYMTAPMYGYAMAHAAWLRGERKTVLARHLRSDASCCFKQSLRYLEKTGDSTFNPKNTRH